MITIHILNVGHGDSILIESMHDGKKYWSIVDCKKVGNYCPTINFLKEHNVTAIQSVILTHLHADHHSGIPLLAAYLNANNIPVENSVTPLPTLDANRRVKFINSLFPNNKNAESRNALNALEALDSFKDANGNPHKAEPPQISRKYTPDWTTLFHPGLEFSFINPCRRTLNDYLDSALTPPADHDSRYKQHNALSMVFMVRPTGSEDLYIFTGDVCTKPVINTLKRRTERIVGSSFASHIRFLKAPHHGSFKDGLEDFYKDFLHPTKQSVVCVSCPSASTKHPHPDLQRFAISGQKNFRLACTGKSPYCPNSHNQPFFDLLFNHKARHLNSVVQATKSSNQRGLRSTRTPCHGNITISSSNNGPPMTEGAYSDVCDLSDKSLTQRKATKGFKKLRLKRRKK